MENIIYIRTSTEDQNPENQIKDCLSINKYGEYEIYQDKQSAWKDNIERDQFNKLEKEIKIHKIKHLIVWDLDRLYRNRLKLKAFFELCKIYNCKVHSFRQQWLESLNDIQPPFNDIMFDLMLQIMGWLAEDESNKKSARVKIAIRYKDGITLSYKGNKWGRKELSKQTVQKVMDLHKLGKSIRDIHKEVIIYDKNNNARNISIGAVHKIVKQNSVNIF